MTHRKCESLLDTLYVVYWILCLGLWFLLAPGLISAFDMLSGGRADGFGMGMYATFVIVVNTMILIFGIALSTMAVYLPLWFRIASLIPGLAGVVAGLWIIVVLAQQGK